MFMTPENLSEPDDKFKKYIMSGFSNDVSTIVFADNI